MKIEVQNDDNLGILEKFYSILILEIIQPGSQKVTIILQPDDENSQPLPHNSFDKCVLFSVYSGSIPKSDNDGRGLSAGRDECDDEEEDEEGNEGAAGAVTLPRHGVAVLVQVGLDDDQLQLVDLAVRGGGDDLPALDTRTVRVVPDLRDGEGTEHQASL